MTVFIHLHGRLRNELVLVDAPFTEIGDDVTVDHDGQVRCHSFEERCTVGLCVSLRAKCKLPTLLLRLQVPHAPQPFCAATEILLDLSRISSVRGFLLLQHVSVSVGLLASCLDVAQGFSRVELAICVFRLFVTCLDLLVVGLFFSRR